MSPPRKKSTAQNAVLLFHSLMKHRYGPKWNTDVSAPAIAAVAQDVAQGFGGAPRDIEAVNFLARGDRQCRWRFPDGSVALSCPRGLIADCRARAWSPRSAERGAPRQETARPRA
ncbi:hypothetical protein IHV25_05345 [Phaeovibrio sulfidiphilus]|uniref:Uncharacterized protein n=1 Tax=Phaeovibrio sulfidiphilus TaxID=1220600 RepID=A0A8J7CDJ9_9PROT|nr:hypothetical protein [Phaeovibrio sulfidiphilus]MBE1237069.1 hypothetical protein [Phaeovibrio sulfidiphilus]